MSITRVLLVCISLFTIASISEAQIDSAKAGAEILHLIRKEKFDLILPGAMRDNNVDMWIHVIRTANPDPMEWYFGSASGYIIFTDRGGNRIERAILGGGGSSDLYDLFASSDTLKAFVAERDPKKIAVNTSAWLAMADGISHSEYLKLENILGSKYSRRIVSAENVITDFIVRRVQREIVAFANASEMHRQILERALSNEVITPGVTTLGDVGWWVQDQLRTQGLLKNYSMKIRYPRVLYSVKSQPIEEPNVRWWIHYPEYVIQRGDFMTFLVRLRYLNAFSTDFKRNLYVMQEGETTVPESIQRAFNRAVNARGIIRKTMKSGKTAGETLQAVASALEKEGYIHTPFTNNVKEDYTLVKKMVSGDKSGFSIDLHSVAGNNDYIGTVGPSVSPFHQNRAHLKIQENYIFSLEYMVHTALTERPGYPMSVNIEDNHIVTSRGVEWLHPPNERILLIH
jgi:Xaa-Pro aminopeptidase